MIGVGQTPRPVLSEAPTQPLCLGPVLAAQPQGFRTPFHRGQRGRGLRPGARCSSHHSQSPGWLNQRFRLTRDLRGFLAEPSQEFITTGLSWKTVHLGSSPSPAPPQCLWGMGRGGGQCLKVWLSPRGPNLPAWPTAGASCCPDCPHAPSWRCCHQTHPTALSGGSWSWSDVRGSSNTLQPGALRAQT